MALYHTPLLPAVAHQPTCGAAKYPRTSFLTLYYVHHVEKYLVRVVVDGLRAWRKQGPESYIRRTKMLCRNSPLLTVVRSGCLHSIYPGR